MAKKTHRLTPVAIKNLKKPGLHPDGAGLYIKVLKTGGKSFVYRYMVERKARYAGLGSVSTVTLTEARAAAADLSKQIERGIDPLAARKTQGVETKVVEARRITFKEFAEGFIKDHERSWRNPKHRQQWRNTLQTYCFPHIGHLPVADITTDHVANKILKSIWTSRPETASRVRGRIETILDAAKALELRSGENPAHWRGHLSNLLPATKKLKCVRHHPALPYSDLPEFVAELRDHAGVSAECLEFTILTAARTTEARAARWIEFDLEKKVWTVPADRMKAGKPHRVPLSDRCVAILNARTVVRRNEYVFPGNKPGRPLSNMAMLELARGMRGLGNISVHGFRSTLRDWASETQREHFHDAVVECALAHVIPNKSESAYRRGDLLEPRRALMTAWETHCLSQSVKRDHIPENVDDADTIAAAA